MADESELLHVDGHTFDTDDLTYAERRQIKILARTEIWDEDVDGEFQNLNEDDLMPAIITVFMRRHIPSYTLADAAKHRPSDVFRENGNGGPPTQPQVDGAPKRAAKRSSTRSSPKTPSAISGDPS